ncbi:MAG: copper resistance protein B [Pseudomonadota bacterium]
MKNIALIRIIICFFTVFSANLSYAEEVNHEHGSQIFHSFNLEVQTGNARREGAIQNWDFIGWIGGDVDKLYLKSEGERLAGKIEKAEFQALYSRNIATFWDAQIGIRQDTSPHPDTYLTIGFDGIAPYYFETKAHIFVSDKGYVSARLRAENNFLITQKLIIKPYSELNASFANDEKQQLGAGLSNAEFGIQTRYEINRKFAPYIDFRYERKFGNTIKIVQNEEETADDFIASIGIKIMF